MGISTAVYAAVRSTARRNYTGSASQELDINRGGDVMLSQGLPPHSSIVSMGGSWVTQVKTGDATSPLNAIPTSGSTIDFQLYNAAAAGSGVCLVIDSVFFICQTSQAAADWFSLLGQIVGPGIAAAPTAYTSVVTSLNGKGQSYNGSATRGNAVTTSVTNAWFALGTPVNTQALTATAGLTGDFDCFGKYIVQPTGSFFLQTMASVITTAKMVCGCRWHEITLDNG